MTTHALTMLNEHGDTTFVWTEDEDERIEKMIAQKMKEGYTFFITEPRFFGLIPPKKTELKKASDAKKHRALSLPDGDFAKLVMDGAMQMAKTPDAPAKTTKRASSAKEVARSQSIGVKPRKGG